MIFECPHCRHENEVPEAELTGQVLILECAACKSKFRVVPEETAEEVPSLALPPDERTAVGGTLPEAVAAAEGGVIPSSADFEESDSRTLGEVDTEQHTVPIDTADPELRRARAAEPSTKNAARPPSALDLSGPDTDAEGEGVKTILQGPDRGRPEPGGRRLEAQRVARPESGPPVTVTPSKSNPDVYARIAQAESVSVIPVRRPERERPATKAWNEPSVVQVVASPSRGMRRVVLRLGAQLERAPLFLKVWLLVFPVALGLILILSKRAPEEATPIAIPAQLPAEPQRPLVARGTPPEEAAPAPSPVEAADAPPPAPAPAPPAPSRGPEPPSATLEDSPAPEGMAFVRADGARLRSSPGARGRPVAAVALGTLVRTYEQVDEWVLIMVPPRGPAGFLKRDLLDERRPLSVLAREMAFLGCTAAGGAVSACLDDAERQAQACVAGCREDDRCERACRMAAETCAEACKRR